MKLFRSSHRVAACAVALFAGAASAQAQDVPAAEPAPVEAAPAPEPAPTLMAAPVEEAPMEEAPVEEAPAEEEAAEEGGLSIGMFADAYYNFDWNLPPQSNLGANGGLGHTAYVNSQGFGLAFLGLDATYAAGTVSATASLRFGSAANGLIGQAGNIGIENVWQAYASWAPTDKLSLDFGQYATVYGAEVGESWMNLNYTRGALYFYMQPFWHTGLRANYQATDELAVKVLVANNVNNPLLSVPSANGPSTRAPDLGLQLAYGGEEISAYLGYYGNPIKPDGRNWSHFVDLVVVGAFGDATIVFNGDFGVANREPADSETYFGLSLAAGYKLTPEWGLAARGEYLSATEDYAAHFGESLVTGTLTVEYNVSDSMVIRLDNRLEMADAEIFTTKDDTSKTYISSVLGVAVHTN